MEYAHHGDALVPRQQRFGQYTRSLMKALDVPVRISTDSARPSSKARTKIAPLTIIKDLDKLGLLNERHDVQLPSAPAALRADHRGRQVGPCAGAPAHRPRPSASVHRSGQHGVQLLLWMPPQGERAGDIVLADSTIFTTLFGGTDSLENFWRNLAMM